MISFLAADLQPVLTEARAHRSRVAHVKDTGVSLLAEKQKPGARERPDSLPTLSSAIRTSCHSKNGGTVHTSSLVETILSSTSIKVTPSSHGSSKMAAICKSAQTTGIFMSMPSHLTQARRNSRRRFQND